jgi:DNA-directed RNA polymerase omega subunit
MDAQILENKFKFITVAAARCYQLQRGARPRVESRSHKSTTIAQEEVRQGLIVVREPEHAGEPAAEALGMSPPDGMDVG